MICRDKHSSLFFKEKIIGRGKHSSLSYKERKFNDIWHQLFGENFDYPSLEKALTNFFNCCKDRLMKVAPYCLRYAVNVLWKTI